jgi:hypothetical protein
MATGFVITNATDIAIPKTDRLLVESIKTVQAHDIIGMVDGVKGSAMTPDLLDSGTDFKDGDFTGVNSGGVEVKDILVDNALFTSEEKYQVAKLAATIYKLAMQKGVKPEDFPIEDAVLEIKRNSIAKQYDKAVFLGDTDGVGATLSDKVDGLVKKILASGLLNINNAVEGKVLNSGVAGNIAFAAGTVIAKVVAFCNKFDELLPDLSSEMISVYVSPSNFRIWFQATFGTAGTINALTINDGIMPDKMIHPAFDHFTIVSTKGMMGSNEMFAGQAENFLEVVDGDAESDFMTMHFSKDLEAFLLHTALRLGTAIVHPYQVLLQAVIPA